MTQQQARNRLRKLQDEHGDTFTPEFTTQLGRFWEQGSLLTEERLGGDYTALMRQIDAKVNHFVHGTSAY